MTQLLPIALRGLLPENVRVAIVKLRAFLNAISQKVINPEVLPRLQNDVVQCVVSFELVFPPSFFNIMTHLLVHLVEEISILGPVFLHNMFPFERFMGQLKKYVRNRARPEGSIAKGYGNEHRPVGDQTPPPNPPPAKKQKQSWTINPEPYVPKTTKVPEPSLKPLIPRPWELSVEENAAVVAAQHEKWKADCKKKREPEPKPAALMLKEKEVAEAEKKEGGAKPK
ncbi:hypothetical protein QYE76_032647 [Lolium multiflorum]|uniref:DUF4218 domain-containing protein n=1 Tax=Lolium multiflorum TaxID=4521 RepID=A0AAD8VJJ7_LOLMU|nr:hypothetical protein QYE76_032647 [Lolium multiflorum]